MLEFNTLAEFSRTHCIAICAFLVPANLVATSVTLVVSGIHRPQAQVWGAAGTASIPAFVMRLHVFTWFMIGTVAASTYILLFLGISCLSINLWAGIQESLRARALQSYALSRKVTRLEWCESL